MAFKAQVKTPGDRDWCGNGLVFATKGEAERYVVNLSFRWTLVEQMRVIETDEAVNYIADDGGNASPLKGGL